MRVIHGDRVISGSNRSGKEFGKMARPIKPACLDWSELQKEIQPLRNLNLSVSEISERLGVSVTAFYEFRKKTGVRLKRIRRGRECVGSLAPGKRYYPGDFS